ncbi:hypothetical protein J6590_064230 [Homalodisca vitripennis]|nr:hypothetical protein J6590_064230 [Homalodisca vitripennis]
MVPVTTINGRVGRLMLERSSHVRRASSQDSLCFVTCDLDFTTQYSLYNTWLVNNKNAVYAESRKGIPTSEIQQTLSGQPMPAQSRVMRRKCRYYSSRDHVRQVEMVTSQGHLSGFRPDATPRSMFQIDLSLSVNYPGRPIQLTYYSIQFDMRDVLRKTAHQPATDTAYDWRGTEYSSGNVIVSVGRKQDTTSINSTMEYSIVCSSHQSGTNKM